MNLREPSVSMTHRGNSNGGNAMLNPNQRLTGQVVAVRGSVVDIRFDAHLPPIHSLLHANNGEISIEVLAQLDAHRVRGIAMTPTQGLARGAVVEDTGGPLKAPVGKGIVSQMFDVFGNVIDREASSTVKRRCLMSNGARCIGLRRRWRDDPPSRRSLKRASRRSTCSCRWNAAARRDCSPL